ncbi:protein PFC0760c-like [Rosa chinensis]|uniref:protein PFC0760c-like n=1 Tax=Rosa chinensis TaxID=74649 RepID=UPI000D08BBFE|nr:protein PFC0760c-like [Rosa chinensis]
MHVQRGDFRIKLSKSQLFFFFFLVNEGMRLVWVPRPVFLLLFLAVVLVLSSLFQSISKQKNLQFSSNPLFVFSLCNIIIFAIIVGDHRPPTEEVDSILPFLSGSAEDATDGVEDDGSNKHCNMDGHVNGSEDVDDQVDESEEEDGEYDSDGYNEDDDDNGSDDEIGWEDTDESDDNLETRVENFIDRVYKGWREERLRDTPCNPLQFLGCINPL